MDIGKFSGQQSTSWKTKENWWYGSSLEGQQAWDPGRADVSVQVLEKGFNWLDKAHPS